MVLGGSCAGSCAGLVLDGLGFFLVVDFMWLCMVHVVVPGGLRFFFWWF